MKCLKIIFSILGLLIVVCALAIGSLMFFMDPNKLKPAIVEETMKKTGYQLEIDGSLSWSFYPNLAITAEGMKLSAPHQPTPFIELHGVRMAMELSQLLRGNETWQGNLLISTAKLMNVRAENVSTDVHWNGSVLTLQPLRASLYRGSLTGKATGRDLSSLPRWQWEAQFSDIQIQPLLQDVSGPDSKIKISGVGRVKLQAETQGSTRDRILNNMNGTGEFALNDGIVYGIDLNYLVQTADALINKETMAQPEENVAQTTFSSLTGSMAIKQGVAETNTMLLTSPAFTTKGEGTVGLLSRALNFHLLVKPQPNAKIQWKIPVLVTGELSHPDVRLDRVSIEKLIVEQEWDKLKTKAVEQIKEHVPGKAGEFLQNLLGK